MDKTFNWIQHQKHTKQARFQTANSKYLQLKKNLKIQKDELCRHYKRNETIQLVKYQMKKRKNGKTQI